MIGDSINVTAAIARFRYNCGNRSRRPFVATLLKANAWQLDGQVVNVYRTTVSFTDLPASSLSSQTG